MELLILEKLNSNVMSKMIERAIEIIEKIAELESIEKSSIEYQQLENKFFEDPISFAQEYDHLLSEEEFGLLTGGMKK